MELLKREKKCNPISKVAYALLIIYSAFYGVNSGNYGGFLIFLTIAVGVINYSLMIKDYSIINTIVGKEASLNINGIYIACIMIIFVYAMYVFRDNASVTYLLRNIFLFFLIN